MVALIAVEFGSFLRVGLVGFCDLIRFAGFLVLGLVVSACRFVVISGVAVGVQVCFSMLVCG